jgi:hypothetical protein
MHPAARARCRLSFHTSRKPVSRIISQLAIPVILNEVKDLRFNRSIANPPSPLLNELPTHHTSS